MRLPPGPTGFERLRALTELFRDPLRFNCRMRGHGPLTALKLGPELLYFVNDAQLIEELLRDHASDCIKDLNTRALRQLLGQGLLTSDGEAWRDRRRLMAPSFQPRRSEEYLGIMRSVSQRYAAGLIHGQLRDFHADAMRLSLEVVSQALLGVGAEREAARFSALLTQVIAFFERRLFSPARLLPWWLPAPDRLRFQRAKQELHELLRALLAEAGAPRNGAGLLVERLLAARRDGTARLSESELMDELLTLLIAGHETTALLLSHAVFLLSTQPDARARLQAELDAARGQPVASGAERLSYLDAVLSETLRLFPPVYALGRQVIREFELGGFALPVRSHVVLSPYSLQRDPAYFADPERFLPERWLDGSLEQLPRCAFIPFGAGPRSCIGSHFALLEAKVVLTTLLAELELQVPGGFVLQHSPVFTLRPKHGLPVRVSRRAISRG